MAFHVRRSAQQGRLLLLSAILFVSYLCVAISLPVIPLHVAATLGLGNGWAGLGVGIAFLATILTRGYAGSLSDSRGSKGAMQRGLLLYVCGAIVLLISGVAPIWPAAAFATLVIGRLFIGLGESLVAVGVISWGIGIVGPSHSGRVLALVGAAIYGALAVGGPIGLFLLDRVGFAGTMAVSASLPIDGLLTISLIPTVPILAARERPSLRIVIGKIWLPGSIVCLQGIGFAAIGSFFALYFRDQNWSYAGLGLTAFGLGFVLVRVFFSRLPDRFGGFSIAVV